MNLTLVQLQQILPGNKQIAQWFAALEKFLPKFDITTTQRTAHFLAQCCHESGNFVATTENLNYRWQTLRKVFPKYFTSDALAQQYANMPNKQEAIANLVYANRMGNGDSASGDGYRYRGRGLIQLTGKNNYQKFLASEPGLTPEYIATPDGAVHSACWFWSTNGLNALADKNDLVAITKRINGGTNGLEDRQAKYQKISQILGA